MSKERGINTSEQISSLSPRAQRHLHTKLKHLDTIYSNPDHRQRQLEFLYHTFQQQDRPQTAHYAIVLGTSSHLYPRKFKSRVAWASQLWHQDKVDQVIFTGRQDHQTIDTNQALTAKNLAIQDFNLPPQYILTVGGNNTQENLSRVRHLFDLRQPRTAFLVSENRHLIRASTAAQHELHPHNLLTYPHPVKGVRMLNPQDPWVTIELIKSFAYHHLYYGQTDFSPQEQEIIQQTVRQRVKDYERQLHLTATEPDQQNIAS